MHKPQCPITLRKYPKIQKMCKNLELGIETRGTRLTNYPIQHTKNLGRSNISNDSKIDVMDEERGGLPHIWMKMRIGICVNDTRLLTELEF